MLRRIAQSLLPVLMLILGACSSPITRWEDEPAPKRTSAPAKARPAPAVRREGPDEYTVKPGDTLYSISFRNQIDFHDLADWNGIGSDYRILPGRVLRLKPRAEGQVARSPSPRPKPVQERVASKPAPTPVIATPSDSTEVAAEPSPVTAPSVPASTASASASAITNSGFEWFWPTTGTILKTYAPQAGFKGLDFGGNLGQPVFAAAPGRVVYSGNALKGYGELIIIKHNDTYLSAYSYNQRRNVKEGDVVTAGQPIGELGLGPESKPFLHFEIRERGQPVDPMRFLPKRETTPGAKLSTN